MKYSISESARIVGVTRKTFYKHIEKKAITVEKDENDNPVVDASELMRVYGDACKFDHESRDSQDTPKDTGRDTGVFNPSTGAEYAVAQKEAEMLRLQMEKERDHFEEQIDYLRNKLDEATSESRKLTALITDQRDEKDKRRDEWERTVKRLEARVSNQEKTGKEDKVRAQKILRQNMALKKALQKEKEKTFWQRLFG